MKLKSLEILEKSRLNKFYMISKNDDYRRIFAIVAFPEESDFFAIFLNFQVKFNSWRSRHNKKYQTSPLEFYRRIQKSN